MSSLGFSDSSSLHASASHCARFSIVSIATLPPARSHLIHHVGLRKGEGALGLRSTALSAARWMMPSIFSRCIRPSRTSLVYPRRFNSTQVILVIRDQRFPAPRLRLRVIARRLYYLLNLIPRQLLIECNRVSVVLLN